LKGDEAGMILIDLPMPEACDVCPFNYDFCWCKAFGNNEEWEKYSDDWNDNVCDRNTRPDYCPLNELDPVETELEGGGSSWWYVCGECHGAIDKNDNYCKHCGRRIKHEKKAE
jgi:hypothetical protein